MNELNGYNEYYCPDCLCSFRAKHYGLNRIRSKSYGDRTKIACPHCGLTMPMKWFRRQHQKALEGAG